MERTVKIDKTVVKTLKPTYEAVKLLVIARSMYGKTVLVAKWVKQMIIAKNVSPKRVLLYSKTYRTDPSMYELIMYCKSKYPGFEENNCHEKIDMDFMTQLFEGQKKLKEQGRSIKHWLLVFDDQISENILTDKKGGLVEYIALMRHYGLSIVISLQSYRGTLSTAIRNGFTMVAVGALSSASATESILDEYDGGLG